MMANEWISTAGVCRMLPDIIVFAHFLHISVYVCLLCGEKKVVPGAIARGHRPAISGAGYEDAVFVLHT